MDSVQIIHIFVSTHGGLIYDVRATFDEKEILKWEIKWLESHGFIGTDVIIDEISIEEARRQYTLCELDLDDDYDITSVELQ